ncbi:MAG: tryptophan synthase subunit alpha [Crocinitomicaceae bacterium]|nr:tryptophan synthase subunit alpha [Flavobacteriales bacterium]NQZ34456.1 tryptophan synthase subunit alpha [Crocinitomicaceae bacterium]
MNRYKKDSKQLSIFITAGYPHLNSLNDQLDLLEAHGIDFVEVGIPFSDPLADGPTIQQTSEIALKNGMNLKILFEQLGNRSSKMPLILMGYLNPIISYGIVPFLESCNRVGVHSVILPDMSLEIYNRFYRDQFEQHGVFPCFLITPTSSTERIQEISEVCKNSFVYLVSSNATTGGKSSFNADQAKTYQSIRSLCGSTPMFIGFGIDSRKKVEFVQNVCDGAIIGSAYLKAVGQDRSDEFLTSLR